jgi:peptide-methionine (S)-S-oxide reductase
MNDPSEIVYPMIKFLNTLVLSTISLVAGLIISGLTFNTIEPMQNETNKTTEKATLGGGCFWCVEAIYQQMKGVDDVIPGYAGGNTSNPTYEEVCSGSTGHAEVIQITYDPSVVSYAEILEVFWKVHDPTTLNRQGPDVGTQYRSIILYHNDKQKTIAEESKVELNRSGFYEDPVVTEIVPLTKFYKAEAYHDDYFKNNPNQPYCTFMIKPKLEKFEKIFKDKVIRQE